MCYILFSHYDISTIQWGTIPTIALVEVLYVVLGGSFGWQKGIAIALVFLGVYIVDTKQVKSRLIFSNLQNTYPANSLPL